MNKYTLYCKCTLCGHEREALADFTKKLGQTIYLDCYQCKVPRWHTVYHWKYNTIKM